MNNVPNIFDPKKPVYIIGGGKSVDNLNAKFFEGKQVIALNKAHRILPDADVFFFGDPVYYERNKAPHGGADFWKFRGEHILTTCDVELHEKSPVKKIATREGGFSVDPEFMGSYGKLMNTGHQAINLAYLAGAREIVLIGFDCTKGQFAAAAAWAHPSTPDEAVYERYMKDFSDLAKEIEGLGIELKIVNATPDSALECWEKVEVKNAHDKPSRVGGDEEVHPTLEGRKVSKKQSGGKNGSRRVSQKLSGRSKTKRAD